MKRHLLVIVSIVVGLVIPTDAVGQRQSSEVAFVGVNVIPMDSKRVLPRHTVIIRQGRIAELGPSRSIRIPKGMTRVDGRGKYLIPGLVDMHIHVYSDESDLFLYLANGVTTVRSMAGKLDHIKLRERINKGEVLGPRLYTCSPIIPGLTDADEARNTTLEYINAGYDCIKIYNTRKWTIEAYAAVIETTKQHGIPAVGHIPLNLPLEDLFRTGLVTAEHTEQFLYSVFMKSENGRRNTKLAEEQIPSVAKLMKDNRVALTPTLAVYSTIPLMLSDAGTNSLLSRREVKYINKDVRAKWIAEQTNNYKRRFGPERIQYFKDNLAFLERFTAGLHDNGVGILLGSDSAEDQSFMVPGFSIHDELRELVAAGLTPFEAIQAGTINAARALNAEGELGTIAVGKSADLILLAGNPLNDVTNLRRVSGVMLRGTWLPETTIRRRLNQLAAVARP